MNSAVHSKHSPASMSIAQRRSSGGSCERCWMTSARIVDAMPSIGDVAMTDIAAVFTDKTTSHSDGGIR